MKPYPALEYDFFQQAPTMKRSLRRPTNTDNIMMASQQARLASRNDTYRAATPAPRLARPDNSLDAYTRAIAAAGTRAGVDDDTISKRTLRRFK